MAKKNDGQITPDNFLDAYKPVSPQRRTDKVDAEAETELPKVEETQEDNRKNPGSVLPRRQNGVVKTPKDYQDIFLRPNLGESMRYGKTYYVSKDDCKKIKCFSENVVCEVAGEYRRHMQHGAFAAVFGRHAPSAD